ncbi:CNDH2 protein, partial [Rhinopomastus cyanomelas]|nr:CNDH2 protein [Rhinopomastus cyanomelas]
MEEFELRFQHLLQPIRDLTKNWEVDVAAQLEEYLDELEQICISFDNGRTTMNFTEAAMVIQGSACIYSRKVEYLYSLVYQALDLISNKKRQKLPSSLGPDGKDADANFEEEEFLSLDDLPNSSQASVDLSKDQQPNSVSIIPLIPVSLLPPEEDEKRDNPLLSVKGELLASRKDFRMNTSTPHPSGVFLLEPLSVSPISLQLRVASGLPKGGPPGGGGLQLSTPAGLVQALSFLEEPVSVGLADADEPGGAEDAEVAAEEHMEVQRVGTVGAPDPIVSLQGGPQGRGYALRERATAHHPTTHAKELLDPWQSLDPFSECQEKPFKQGKPFLLPPGLDEVVGGKRKRRRSRQLQDFAKWFSAAYDGVAYGRRTCRKGPTFADLEELYWKHLKKQVLQRKLQTAVFSPLQEPLLHEEREEEREADWDEGADDCGEQEDLPGDQEALVEGDLEPPAELGYEELVRRNVEQFLAHSQQYAARDSELSQRVRLWEEHIGPLLHQQEEQRPFDIRRYEQELVDSCKPLGQWHSLPSLLAGRPSFEVCRYLLATLQLANDYVVELAQEPGLEEAMDTARLRLLDPHPAHQRFQTFQPRSA